MIAARVEQNQKMVQSGWREHPCPCRGPCQNLFLNEVEDRNAKPVGPIQAIWKEPYWAVAALGYHLTSVSAASGHELDVLSPAQPSPGVSDE